MSHPLIHICGIPGAGKSDYSKWLVSQKGFRRLETDKLLENKGSEEDLALIRLIDSPRLFLSALQKLDCPVVLDYGFHPYYDFDRVQRLWTEGIARWWFDADLSAARQAFIKRGDVDPKAFNIQVTNIQSRWPELKGLLEKKIIRTLEPNGVFLDKEDICRIMFPV